jgi:hypothetical protein
VLLFELILLFWALLFGHFIFGYGKLGLLNQGVHKFLFEGVHNFI